MMPRTFGELAQTRNHLMQARCSFCDQVKGDCLKYSTRHYICGQCLAPRRAELLPSIARAQAKARKAADTFIRELGHPARSEEIDREVNFLHAMYRCGEDYARECVAAAVGRARRKGGR